MTTARRRVGPPRRPNCFRSVAASPVTACGRRCASSSTGFRSRSTRSRPARRCSTGLSLRSGTSRDAYVSTPSGERVIDFRTSNLHVVSYSIPVHARMTLAELRPHLHTLPHQPDAVPYRTSYYNESWGFCLSQRLLDSLPDGEYDVHIDSTLRPGSLTYGELVVPGETERARDHHLGTRLPPVARRRQPQRHRRCDAAGPAVARRAPPTSHGPLPVRTRHDRHDRLARHQRTTAHANRPRADADLSRRRPSVHVQADGGRRCNHRPGRRPSAGRGRGDHRVVDFSPYGYDERQYNSPGFRLPVGSLMRGRHGEFPEYHTSLDNLDFVSGARMAESLDVVAGIVDVVDRNRTMRNLAPLRRAATRRSRTLRGARRYLDPRRPAGDAVAPQPLGRVAHVARHRRAFRPRVRHGRGDRRVARAARPPGRGTRRRATAQSQRRSNTWRDGRPTR